MVKKSFKETLNFYTSNLNFLKTVEVLKLCYVLYCDINIIRRSQGQEMEMLWLNNDVFVNLTRDQCCCRAAVVDKSGKTGTLVGELPLSC